MTSIRTWQSKLETISSSALPLLVLFRFSSGCSLVVLCHSFEPPLGSVCFTCCCIVCCCMFLAIVFAVFWLCSVFYICRVFVCMICWIFNLFCKFYLYLYCYIIAPALACASALAIAQLCVAQFVWLSYTLLLLLFLVLTLVLLPLLLLLLLHCVKITQWLIIRNAVWGPCAGTIQNYPNPLKFFEIDRNWSEIVENPCFL